MIVAIANAGSGKMPIITFEDAVDVTAGIAAHVTTYDPDENVANFIGIEATSGEENSGLWSYDYTGPALVADTFGDDKSTDYLTFRNSLISTHEPNWSSLTNAEKKRLIENYVWPSEETTTNLDALYPLQQRKDFAALTVKKLNSEGCMIRASVSNGSIKYYDHGADDTATMVVAEITTDVIMVAQYG